MSSVRISELPLISTITDLDVLVINDENTVTCGIQVAKFVESFTSKDLNFTGTIQLDDVTIDGSLEVNGDTNFNNTVTFNDAIIFNDQITIGPNNGIKLNDISDVNAPSPVSGQVLLWVGDEWQAGATGQMNDLVDDVSPQLGGDLDVNGFKITSAQDGDIIIAPEGTGQIYFQSDGNQAVNAVRFYDEKNIYYVSVTVPEHADMLKSLNLKLPADEGQPGYVLKTDGAGNLTWAEDGGGGGGGGGGDFDLTAISVTTGGAKDGGELTYNNLNGIFTYNPADISNLLKKDEIGDISINDLSDVDTETNEPLPGQALIWDGSSNNWMPNDVLSGMELDDLSDVEATSPGDGDILIYEAGKWESKPNMLPQALIFRGVCNLTLPISAQENEDVDNDPADRQAGWFWVNSSDSTGIIASSWEGIAGRGCSGLEYVVWTVDNEFSILGKTGDVSPVVEVVAGTGISVTGDPQEPVVSITDTGVTPGTYNIANLTVDPQGRITAIDSGLGPGGELEQVLDDYVRIDGDTMTGPLNIQGVDNSIQIVLNPNGSGIFRGIVYTGDAADNNQPGARIHEDNQGYEYRSNNGGFYFKGYNIDDGDYNVAIDSTGDASFSGEITGNTLVTVDSITSGTSIDATTSISAGTSTSTRTLSVTSTSSFNGDITLNANLGVIGGDISIFTGTLKIGSLVFPNTDGLEGNTLITDGSGNITWGEAGATVSIGITPPSSPDVGDLWFDNDEGIMYVYYEDTDSTQWVDTRPATSLPDPFVWSMDLIQIDSLQTLPVPDPI